MNEEHHRDESEDRILDLLRKSEEPTSHAHDSQVRGAIAQSAKRIRNAKSADRLWGSNLWAPLGLAAALILAVGVGLFMWTDLEDPLRAPVEHSSVTPAHQARLRAMPERLEWPQQPGAQLYRIKLRAASGRLVWSGESEGRPEIELPPDVIAESSGERSYVWAVEIEGARRGELGPYWFHVSE